MHSLRTRLLLMVLAVLAITVIAASLLFARFSVNEFRTFVESEAHDRAASASTVLGEHHAAHGGWDGVEALLDQIYRAGGRAPLLVTDNLVLAPPAAGMDSVRATRTPGGVRIAWRGEAGGRVSEGVLMFEGGTPVRSGGRTVGEVFLGPSAEMQSGHEVRFADSLRRSAVLAVAIAGLAALLLAFALSRRIFGPVEALAGAVRAMAGGRLDQRVEVSTRDEIGELGLAFNDMAGRLAANERLRRDMVSDVAHELRTPVTHLRAQVEALQDGLAAPDAATLASLHEEILHLGALIDDLQDLAAADSGHLVLEPAALALGEEFGRARVALTPLAEAAGVRLEFAAAESLPCAQADARRLGQVLRNLIANAVTHSPEGADVAVTAEAGPGATIRVSVRDRGAGLSTEQAARVFERFYRADASRARATGGAGLGLAIVRQLVEAMGGTTGVDSAPGSGSTFWFTLPRAADPSAPPTR
jgi:signal transduction histidine kinase